MRNVDLPDIKTIEELLDLDKKTGVFRWKPRPRRLFKTQRACSTWNARFAGKEAGYSDPLGYIRICIKRDGIVSRNYLAHRLVYFVMTGEQPTTIDHIDMNPSNNAPSNLRAASSSENNCNAVARRNNETGYKGVDARYGKFRARIRKNGVQKYLGMFDTAEEAHEAYKTEAARLHGQFART